MKTIQLNINEKVYERVMWLLNKFSADEVEIITDDQYASEKEDLINELYKIDSGKASFNSVEELEEILEKRISKYED